GADITSGNSGGPLIDSCGRAVGVNTFGIRDDATERYLNYSLHATDLLEFLGEASVSAQVETEGCRPQVAPPQEVATAPEAPEAADAAPAPAAAAEADAASTEPAQAAPAEAASTDAASTEAPPADAASSEAAPTEEAPIEAVPADDLSGWE
ncbi:MAG: trypsin-like serine protease, partial [Pseudomonadota bacterium]